ncbi:MAG TPA: PaaI family thioesterase [Candidatus Dormibacteraeota bacterium]|nr:PaaI family thioesterase [Candidatus Dormibacteraeota bacterium]
MTESATEIVPVILRHPPPGVHWGKEALRLTGLEQMRAARDRRLPEPPISTLTGLRVTDVGLGKATFAMPASPWWQSGAGVFLAGTLAFVADAPLGCAIFTSAPPATGLSTSELSINFLRPAGIRSETLIARGHLIHETRSTGLSEASIEDGRGRLLAHATSRCILTPIPAAVAQALTQQESAVTPLAVDPAPYLTPAQGDVYGQEVWDTTPGIDLMRRFVDGQFSPPVFRLMGIRGIRLADGEMTIAMPASGWLLNALGVIYGGALALLADAAITLATATIIPPATAFSPLDLKVNYLRPVFPSDGELVASARLVHRGRTITVVTCEIVNAQGKAVAIASGSVLILPGRPWDRPVIVQDELASSAGLSPG